MLGKHLQQNSSHCATRPITVGSVALLASLECVDAPNADVSAADNKGVTVDYSSWADYFFGEGGGREDDDQGQGKGIGLHVGGPMAGLAESASGARAVP